MLTATELKQIKDYLAQYGKKDTQLNAARVPLTGQEQIAIVQDGENRIAPFSEILEAIGTGLNKDVCTYAAYLRYETKSTQTFYIITDDGTINGTVQQIFLGEMPLRDASINSVHISVDKPTVFAGTEVLLTATATANADSLNIKKGDTIIEQATFVPTLQTSVVVNTTTQFDTKATILGYTYYDSVEVEVVNPIYYGSGTDFEDFWDNKGDGYSVATNSPIRAYDITVRQNSHYVYFAIPETMEINSATLSDIEFPFGDPDTLLVNGYKVYKSVNTYNAETLTIIIS